MPSFDDCKVWLQRGLAALIVYFIIRECLVKFMTRKGVTFLTKKDFDIKSLITILKEQSKLIEKNEDQKILEQILTLLEKNNLTPLSPQEVHFLESNKLTYLKEYLQSNRLRYNKSKCK